MTQGQIAKKLGVHRNTIVKDLRLWRESGGFEDWLYAEFMRLHGAVKSDGEESAYRVVSRLLERTMAQRVKAEVEARGERTVVVKMWRPSDAGDNV